MRLVKVAFDTQACETHSQYSANILSLDTATSSAGGISLPYGYWDWPCDLLWPKEFADRVVTVSKF